MGNISNGMETICKDIAGGYENRMKDIKDLRKQMEIIRDNARKFVNECKKLHLEMAKNLKESLLKSREDLTKEVDSLRKDFRKSQKEVRADLAEASKAWSEMSKALQNRRK